ncbi:MAG: hypothetical protein ACREJC_03215, partial [Tepidisphaeraceae bacterium]
AVWVHALVILASGRASASTGFWIATAVGSVLAVPITWLVWRLSATVYFKLLIQEFTGKVPPVLVANLLAYCLTPSVLSPIPIVGPPLALAWILALGVIAGVRRMQVSVRGAVIGVFIVTIIWAAIGTAAYFTVPALVRVLLFAIESGP